MGKKKEENINKKKTLHLLSRPTRSQQDNLRKIVIHTTQFLFNRRETNPQRQSYSPCQRVSRLVPTWFVAAAAVDAVDALLVARARAMVRVALRTARVEGRRSE